MFHNVGSSPHRTEGSPGLYGSTVQWLTATALGNTGKHCGGVAVPRASFSS